MTSAPQPAYLRATEGDPQAPADTAPYERLSALLRDDLAAVNRIIVERMQSPVALIPQLAGYIVSAGGKRLRPLLTLASAALCGYRGDRHRALAACVEFIHTATLLHDDVVDDSDLRRGLASANAVFGNEASVLVGDFLFSRAFQIMVADGSLDVLRILSQASATISEGEVLQLTTTGDLGTDEAAYLRVIEDKTAALFAAACEIGAVIAERPQAEADALRDYGSALGIAFQIADDVLDYSAERARLGKAIGDDFREGKLTMPVLLAYRAATGEDRAFWERSIGGEERDEAALQRAIALIEATGAGRESLIRARLHADRARAALDVFPPSRLRSLLAELAAFAVDRAY